MAPGNADVALEAERAHAIGQRASQGPVPDQAEQEAVTLFAHAMRGGEQEVEILDRHHAPDPQQHGHVQRKAQCRPRGAPVARLEPGRVNAVRHHRHPAGVHAHVGDPLARDRGSR